MNESKIVRLRGFGVKNGGGINLGVAAPLFVPLDSSRLNYSRGENAAEGVFVADQTHDHLNMTRNLLQALQPSRRQHCYADDEVGQDDFLNADDENRENGIDLVDVEYPTSFSHLVKILYKTEIKHWLYLSNPDGYFYFLFIKICVKFFICSLVVSLAIQRYHCQDASATILCELDLFDPSVYQTILGATIGLSLLADYFLYEFCLEMMECEFQPDKQIMD